MALRVAAVIPARLGSRRFPRKVLARDTGKYLVEHVYERVLGCPGVDRVVIATDSEEVVAACRSFGADVALTSPDHVSGTDRVAEVAAGLPHDVVINVQGDEPLIEHSDLRTLVELFPSGAAASQPAAPQPEIRESSGGLPAGRTVMTTLAARRTDEGGFRDPNVVKVVLAGDGYALYFSRSPVPYWPQPAPARGAGGAVPPGDEPLEGVPWYQHIGIYAYRRDFLLELARLPPTPLEARERLEQLRVLENGFRIRVGVTSGRHLGIDTEEEYRRFVEEYLESARHPTNAND